MAEEDHTRGVGWRPRVRSAAAPDPLGRLDDARRLLRGMGECVERIASEEGWPRPFRPVRLLVLHHLDRSTVFGLSAVRLAHLLHLGRSSLAHHLEVLEDAGLVDRRPRRLGDARKVAVCLTEEGTYALRRLRGTLEQRADISDRPSPC